MSGAEALRTDGIMAAHAEQRGCEESRKASERFPLSVRDAASLVEGAPDVETGRRGAPSVLPGSYWQGSGRDIVTTARQAPPPRRLKPRRGGPRSCGAASAQDWAHSLGPRRHRVERGGATSGTGATTFIRHRTTHPMAGPRVEVHHHIFPPMRACRYPLRTSGSARARRVWVLRGHRAARFLS